MFEKSEHTVETHTNPAGLTDLKPFREEMARPAAETSLIIVQRGSRGSCVCVPVCVCIGVTDIQQLCPIALRFK